MDSPGELDTLDDNSEEHRDCLVYRNTLDDFPLRGIRHLHRKVMVGMDREVYQVQQLQKMEYLPYKIE